MGWNIMCDSRVLLAMGWRLDTPAPQPNHCCADSGCKWCHRHKKKLSQLFSFLYNRRKCYFCLKSKIKNQSHEKYLSSRLHEITMYSSFWDVSNPRQMNNSTTDRVINRFAIMITGFPTVMTLRDTGMNYFTSRLSWPVNTILRLYL